MKAYAVRFAAPKICKNCVIGYRVEADGRLEAAEQARRIAKIEHPGIPLILLSSTPAGAIHVTA